MCNMENYELNSKREGIVPSLVELRVETIAERTPGRSRTFRIYICMSRGTWHSFAKGAHTECPKFTIPSSDFTTKLKLLLK